MVQCNALQQLTSNLIAHNMLNFRLALVPIYVKREAIARVAQPKSQQLVV